MELWAKRLSLTPLEKEPEEYVLTPEEEEVIIKHRTDLAKHHYQYRHLELGESLESIEMKMSKINWDKEIDRDELLKESNTNKIYELKQKKHQETAHLSKLEKYQHLKSQWNAKTMYNCMSWTSKEKYGKDLISNEDNKHFISSVCFFLSQDERFETELGYSLSKGLLIRGISGLGKTFIIKCIKDNEFQPIKIISMIEIAEIIKSEGSFALPPNPAKIIYLDDVGSEESSINHYGTKINFFKNFIELFYLNNTKFNKLIISTNNDFNEIEEKYGFRVRSRIKDMFNIINVSGTDMRG